MNDKQIRRILRGLYLINESCAMTRIPRFFGENIFFRRKKKKILLRKKNLKFFLEKKNLKFFLGFFCLKKSFDFFGSDFFSMKKKLVFLRLFFLVKKVLIFEEIFCLFIVKVNQIFNFFDFWIEFVELCHVKLHVKRILALISIESRDFELEETFAILINHVVRSRNCFFKRGIF